MVFNLAHLPYWILLSVGVLLFLLVIFSGGEDSDIEVEGDLDIDGAEADFSGIEVLGWLGLGEAPLLLLLAIDFTLWGLSGWVLNLLLGIPGGALGNGILILSLIFSLGAGKLMARPIGQLFATFGEDVTSDRLIGCTGEVVSVKLPQQPTTNIGQVDVIDSAHNLVSINVQLPDWATVTPQRGDRVIIIEYCHTFYLAIAKDSVDHKRWLG